MYQEASSFLFISRRRITRMMNMNLTFLHHTACWISSLLMMTFLRLSTEPWSGPGRRGTRSGCSGGTLASRTPGTGGSEGCWIRSYVNHLICIDIDNIYTQWEGGPPWRYQLIVLCPLDVGDNLFINTFISMNYCDWEMNCGDANITSWPRIE